MLSKKLNRFLSVVIVLFCSALAVLLAGRNHFVFGTGLILFRWLFLGVGLILLYVAYARAFVKPYIFLLMVLLVGLLGEYAWNVISRGSLKERGFDTEVSVMTYNVFFRNASPALSIANIKRVDPDILLVQELTPEWNAVIENAVGKKYSYRRIKAIQGTHGIGVYSKYPISKSELLNNESGRPYAQLLELSIHDKKIQVINVQLASPAVAVEDPKNFISHFHRNYNVRKQQLDEITQIARSGENQYDAQLVLGDLNTTSFEPIYRNFRKHWVNLYDESGNGLGLNFPNSSRMAPVLTLDYAFGRGFVEGVSFDVVEGGSSDHLAIAGRIKL